MKKQFKLQSGKIRINYAGIGIALTLSILIFGLLYWQELRKQKFENLISKFQVEYIHEIIYVNEENRSSSFMNGSTEKYALFSAPAYYKKCLIDTNAQNIEELDDIKDFEYIPTYKKRELLNMYKSKINISVVKINTNDFIKVKCEGFSWNEELGELYYEEKPVRFMVKNLNYGNE